MLTEFGKFKGWAVMEFFLRNPYTAIYAKELARKLKISKYSSQYYTNLNAKLQ